MPWDLSTTAQPELFHGYRSGRYAGDANDHRLGNRCGRHAVRPDAHNQAHARGLGCATGNRALLCKHQGFGWKSPAHAPGLGHRASDDACARRANNRRDRCAPEPYARSFFHGYGHGFRDG